MSEKPSAFISYSQRDIDPELVSFLRARLEAELRGAVRVHCDSDVPPGGDLATTLDALGRADVVIPILSPSYAERARAREGAIGREFELIAERYLASRSASQATSSDNSKMFSVFPVLMHPDGSRCRLPKPVEHIRWVDLDGTIRLDKDGSVHLIARSRSRFNKEVRKLVSEILTRTTLNSEDFRKHDRTLRDKLFVDLKDDGNLDPDLFVKTRPYERVRDQEVFLLIGRKGSGKSTVTSFLTRYGAGNYKGTFEINVDGVKLESLFALVNEAQIASDTRNVVSLSEVFEFTWELFLNACAMHVLANPEVRQKLTARQLASLPAIEAAIRDILPDRDPDDATAVLLTYCLNQVVELINRSILEARSDTAHFDSDIQARFNLGELIQHAFSGDSPSHLDLVLAECEQHILVTLDGFDTAFNEYRDISLRQFDSTLSQQRVRVEVEWLRALLSVTLRAKQNRRDAPPLHRLLDFCLTIPKDRFVEVLNLERDSFRYRTRYSDLTWSGVELAILLRKRLERLAGVQTDKGLSPVQRLERAIEAACPTLPQNLELEHGAKTIKIPTFVYVLRHTFFRPRDVLFYYAKLIALAEHWNRRRIQLKSEDIRRTIKTAAFDVIRDEFVNEFKSTVTNLIEIMERFRDSPLRLDANAIGRRIGGTPFHLAQSPDPVTDLGGKVRFLISIGFLGVSLSEERRAGFGFKNRDVFSFTELRVMDEIDQIVEGILAGRFKESKLLVHPVFIQRLTLDNSDAFEIMRFSWDYLRETDAMVDV